MLLLGQNTLKNHGAYVPSPSIPYWFVFTSSSSLKSSKFSLLPHSAPVSSIPAIFRCRFSSDSSALLKESQRDIAKNNTAHQTTEVASGMLHAKLSPVNCKRNNSNKIRIKKCFLLLYSIIYCLRSRPATRETKDRKFRLFRQFYRPFQRTLIETLRSWV